MYRINTGKVIKLEGVWFMKQEEVALSTDEELLLEQKKLKKNKMLNGFLIGFLIGVSIWSAVKNGFSFWTFFPLIIAYLAFFKSKKSSS